MSPLLKTILILPVPPGVGQIEIFPRDYHFCSKYPTLHANVLAAIQIYQKWPRKEPLWNLTYALTPSPIKLKIHLGIEDTLPLVLNWTFLGWSVCWKGLKGQWGPGSFEIFEKLVHPWRASHGFNLVYSTLDFLHHLNCRGVRAMELTYVTYKTPAIVFQYLPW